MQSKQMQHNLNQFNNVGRSPVSQSASTMGTGTQKSKSKRLARIEPANIFELGVPVGLYMHKI